MVILGGGGSYERGTLAKISVGTTLCPYGFPTVGSYVNVYSQALKAANPPPAIDALEELDDPEP